MALVILFSTIGITVLVCLAVLNFIISAYEIKYLIGLHEGDGCEIKLGVSGTCQKISNCTARLKTTRNSQIYLKICGFNKLDLKNVICCPNVEIELNNYSQKTPKNSLKTGQKPSLLDFETCQKEFLKFREQKINPSYFGKAMYDGIIPINKTNCIKLHRLNNAFRRKDAYKNLDFYYCDLKNDVEKYIKFRKRVVRTIQAYYGSLSRRGDRANMAAIGWTQRDKSIKYGCGGSIITERFIVTAAHCKYFQRSQADTVRLGDRFLLNLHDDDKAQQHKILKFIQHPEYKSRISYNDIAMIKTKTNIIFNNFVNPACIGDFDGEYSNDWTVAGYGETEDNIQSNVLTEIKVNFVSYDECNSTFAYSSMLPNGILDSQFCGKSENLNGNIPDTCFGDSGSPLQSKVEFEVNDDNFNTTFLSTIYETPTVLGIVSFGVSCGYNIPSVYTKLSYYKSWMRFVIENE